MNFLNIICSREKSNVLNNLRAGFPECQLSATNIIATVITSAAPNQWLALMLYCPACGCVAGSHNNLIFVLSFVQSGLSCPTSCLLF